MGCDRLGSRRVHPADGAGTRFRRQVYVTDTGNHRIQELAPDGTFVREWGGVHFPHGIAIDNDDNVWVTDDAGVRQFSGDGTYSRTGPRPAACRPLCGCLRPSGSVYVADTDTAASCS